MRTFGENVDRLAELAGLSQTEVAARLNVARTQINAWKQDRKIPRLGNLLRLAVVLNCSVDELVDGLCGPYDALRAEAKKLDGRRTPARELRPLTDDEQLVVDGYRVMPKAAQRVKRQEAQLDLSLARSRAGHALGDVEPDRD